MVPEPSTPPKDRKEWDMTVNKIQLRVCNVVNQWLESSFEDFNSRLISQVQRFVAVHIKKDHPPLANKLEKTLQKKVRTDAHPPSLVTFLSINPGVI